jgi:small-conductance mechanosensitive channel
MGVNELIQEILVSNTNSEYWAALIMFAGLFLVFKIFDSWGVYKLKHLSKKTKITWDDAAIDFLESIKWPFFAYLALFIGATSLTLPEIIDKVLKYILILFIVYYLAKGIISVIAHGLDRYKSHQEKKGKGSGDSMINVLKFLAKLIIWIIAFLILLKQLGINITPVLAGAGIAGLAIGLALQGILGDLFAAFTIYFDKPLEEGDFIIVGKDMGVVKNIGIKTTRIQALGGQELVISNSELTSSRINNYKKMNKRRIVFNFGVEYNSTPAQLKKVKKVVEDIINKTEGADLDRVHFFKFGDSSLDFEVVYYVGTSDYNKYMDIQEDLNLQIKEKVEKLGVGFAFPSRTVYMAK